MIGTIVLFVFTAIASPSFAMDKQQLFDFQDYINQFPGGAGRAKILKYDGQTYIITSDRLSFYKNNPHEQLTQLTPDIKKRISRSMVMFNEQVISNGRLQNGLPTARFEIKSDNFEINHVYSFSKNGGFIVLRDFSEYVVVPTSSIKKCLDSNQSNCEIANAVKYKFPRHHTAKIDINVKGHPVLTPDDRSKRLAFQSRQNVAVTLTNLRTNDSTLNENVSSPSATY